MAFSCSAFVGAISPLGVIQTTQWGLQRCRLLSPAPSLHPFILPLPPPYYKPFIKCFWQSGVAAGGSGVLADP